MPILPVSDFWQQSFNKYYKLRWVQQDLWNNKHPLLPQIVVKYNISIIVIMSLILYMIVLSIPISNNISFNSNSRNANPYLYVIYQSIYSYFSYPCTIQFFEISFPDILKNKYVRNIILPIPIFIIITAIYIIYSPIIPSISTDRDYARTLGPFILSCYFSIVYIIIIYSRMCYNNNDNDNNNNNDNYRDIGSVQFSKSSISFSVSTRSETRGKYTTINSRILFENSEISDDSNYGDNIDNYVNNSILQTIYVLLCTLGITAIYYFCQYLTWQWKKQNDNNLLLLYPSFYFIINIIKFVTTRFGRLADANKSSLYSLEILLTFFFTCFYYIFYRNLFIHITSYEYFIFIKVIHIGFELFSYPLRMSKWYFDKTMKLQNNLKEFPILCILYDPSEYHIWSVRLSLDYILTFIVSIASGISYISGILWLRYGYNQFFYDIKDIQIQQYHKVLIFTAISILIEFITYFIIEKLIKYQFQIDVTKHWKVLIHHRPRYIYFFIFMLQHVQTDVMIAKLINV